MQDTENWKFSMECAIHKYERCLVEFQASSVQKEKRSNYTHITCICRNIAHALWTHALQSLFALSLSLSPPVILPAEVYHFNRWLSFRNVFKLSTNELTMLNDIDYHGNAGGNSFFEGIHRCFTDTHIGETYKKVWCFRRNFRVQPFAINEFKDKYPLLRLNDRHI